MSNKNPSPSTRFPVNRHDHTQKHPEGYLTPILKKILSANWEIKDKKIKKLLKNIKVKETVATALVLRRILNGTEGDDQAIERIFERIDGKVSQTLLGEGFGNNVVVFRNAEASKEESASRAVDVEIKLPAR